jgi:hypothetical protein
MKTSVSIALAACTLAALPAAAQDVQVVPETKVTWGGFVKLDVLFSQYSEGEPTAGRDFYVPSSIPVSPGTGDSYSALDLHAKETRLFVKTETDFGEAVGKVGTHVEFDFISGVVSGSEAVTNAYNPALRRAFITYGNWLIGQDWTTFQNLGSIPDTLDFVAWPSEGTVFGRQPMLRYTSGNFAIALENRETLLMPFGGPTPAAPVAVTNDGILPDLTARLGFKGETSEFVVAALVRQLTVDNAGGADDDAIGAGVSVSGKVGLGADDIRFMVTTGDGIGRYVALGTSADAVLDAGGDLEAIGVTAGYLAYRHVWSNTWRSTVTASMFSADNDTALTGTGVTKSVQSFSANLIYAPVPKLLFGTELRLATREIEAADTDGKLTRLQFSTKYLF